MRFRVLPAITALLAVCGLAYSAGVTPPEHLDVPYEPTPASVVDAMLKTANVGPGDVLYDLGCGDGRIVVAAVKKFGATRAVGYDLDPQRLREANENAEMAKVTDKVKFVQGDIFEANFRDATVVTLYLLDEINLKLRPILFQQLQPGTRIVAHAFHMDDWAADVTTHHPKARNKIYYMWIIPARVSGDWTWTTPVAQSQSRFALALRQEFQIGNGRLAVDGGAPVSLKSVHIKGKEITMEAEFPMAGAQAAVTYTGTVDGDTITGKQTWSSGPVSGTQDWVAKRQPVDPIGTWQLAIKPPLASVGDGKLTIAKSGDGTLSASYGMTDAGKPIWHFYDWGASIRFDIPLSEDSQASFLGFIEGDNIHGNVLLPDSSESEWTAVRTSK